MSEPILRGYGLTSASDTSLPVTPDTVFLLASVSKVITGTVVLKLLDLGILSTLDDDICDVVPTSMINTTICRNPHFPDFPVTWRMLVTHRSSLHADVPYYSTTPGTNDDDDDYLEPGYGPTGGYFGLAAGQSTCPMDDVVGFYRDILMDKESETTVGSDLGVNWYDLAQQQMGGMWKTNVAPGEQVEYSNFAVGYIAALVEWALMIGGDDGGGGQSFADFSKQHIFDPLGMTHTAWFRRDLPSTADPMLVEAMPVEPANRRGTKFRDIGHYCFIDYASGSLRSSARDMSKFLHSMLDYGVPDLWLNSTQGHQALSCLEQQPTKTGQGQVVMDHCPCEFGANWILLDKSSTTADEEWLEPYLLYDWTDGAHHDGSEAGCQTQILVLPKAGVYAIVLTNTDGNDEWAAQMLAMELLYALSSAGHVKWRMAVVVSFIIMSIILW